MCVFGTLNALHFTTANYLTLIYNLAMEHEY